jgi:hypothetical protein
LTNLPTNLRTLHILGDFNNPISFLPNLVELRIDGFFNNHLFLPETLCILIINDWFNQPITYFPPQLIYIELPSYWNHALPNLPNTLQYLILGDNYDHVLPHIPPSLLYLEMPQKPIFSTKTYYKHVLVCQNHNEDCSFFHCLDQLRRRLSVERK